MYALITFDDNNITCAIIGAWATIRQLRHSTPNNNNWLKQNTIGENLKKGALWESSEVKINRKPANVSGFSNLLLSGMKKTDNEDKLTNMR